MSDINAYTDYLTESSGDELNEDRKLLIKLQRMNSKLHFAMDSVVGSFHRLQEAPDLLKDVFESGFVKKQPGLVERIQKVADELALIKKDMSDLFEE